MRAQRNTVEEIPPPTERDWASQHTLGAFLGEELLQELLRGAEVRSYATGQCVERSDTCGDVYLVLEGEISLRSRDALGAPLGSTRAGEAIELATALGEQHDWQYRWICNTPARVARFPVDRLEKRLGAESPGYVCLQRVVCYPELRKLARDLQLFGLPEQHVRTLIASLEWMDVVSRIDLRLDAPHLGVVQRGEIEVEAYVDGTRQLVTSYLSGDPLLLGHSDELSCEPAPHTAMWLIPYARWRKIPGADPRAIEQFVQLAEPMTQAGGLGSPLTSRAVASARPREAGASEGPEIEAFVAAPTALARLHRRKRPFVAQHDQMDCGAACMSMVARFFGRRINLPTFRALLHVTREGASLFSLKKAAEHVGLEAIGVQARYEDLGSYLVPFIALTEYHFVVVYRVGPEEIVIGDPARGIVTLRAGEFAGEWSQIALLLKPTPALFEFPQSVASFRKYGKILKGLRASLLEAMLASCLLFVLGLAPPLFMQLLFDRVLPSQDTSLLNGVSLAVLAITITSQLVEWARNYLLMMAGSQADAKFASLFLRRAFDLPLGFFAVRHVGAVTTRLSELAKIRSFLTEQTLAMFIGAVSAVLYAVVLGLYHLELLVVVLTVAPLTLVSVRIFSPRLKRILQQVFKLQSKSRGLAFEHFGRFETIKALNASVAARWRWDENFFKLLDLRRRAARITATITGATSVLDGVTNVVVLLSSVWLHSRGELSLGQVVAANVLVTSITGPISAFASQWEDFEQLGVSFARVDDVITSAPEESGERIPALQGHIEFENLSFQYGSELSPMVLKNVTLAIRPGESVAFVGASGSGKTTLAHMINLLYVPTKGRVLLDGTDAREFSLAELRRQVAMITQENNLFSGTILDNITLGDPHPSFERAMRAAHAADAHDFINDLPDKYSTQLGEGGSGLSGGQKQRINIARALYREPAILVMDEATSSLDSLSERRIIRGLHACAQRPTTIVIAHRLNTVVNADRIYVFERGRLVETGTHLDLMRDQGQYAQLFQKQMAQAR